MFAKPYKQKSNNTLKNSEKKHLVQRILDEFPGVAEERAKDLVPVKSSTSCMRLVLHSGETVGVYVVDGVPALLEVDEALVPTVCALWKVPELVPTLIVHSPVLPKVLGGAPLYLPGVVRGAVPRFQRGGVIAASTHDNAAACIVGRAAVSLQDMQYMAAGVCMEIIHVFGDLLCKEPKFSKIERPKLGTASYPNDVAESLAADINQLSIQPQLKEEWPSLVKQAPAPAQHAPALIPDAPALQAHADANEDDDEMDDTTGIEESQVEEDSIPQDMDGLLQWCLLSFLKLDGKHVELPLKTNLLYRNHLMPLCPSDRTLEVKKSSYKKMGKFLEAMQKEGLLEVREIEKGVDAVVAVNVAHALVRRHHAPERARAAATPEPGQYAPPAIREMFCVTANVAPLFPEHRKGTALTAADVRAAVTQHVRSRSLPAQRACVQLDATLAHILGKQEQEFVKWDEIMNGVQNKLTPSTEMRFSDGTVRLTKSRLEPVTMQVATRSGNKKVTLVSNLEAFGFNLAALAHVCQAGVAASCGVTRSPAAKHDQLMLQGDQTYFIAKLLIEKYGLPKKFVDGADKALKKKK